MENYGIFKGEQLLMVCGSREKAEQMLKNYPGHHIVEVEYVDHRWVKNNLHS